MNEIPSVFRTICRTARKEHRCCECAKTIVPGEEYIISNGCWDGSWQTYKQCSFCHGAFEDGMSVLDDLGYYPDEGPPFGGLWAWLSDSEIAEAIWR